METLATFPTVRTSAPSSSVADSVPCATPAAIPAKSAAEPFRTTPRKRRAVSRAPSRSVTILTIVALATWALVWWIERGRRGDPGGAVMAAADAPRGEAVVR